MTDLLLRTSFLEKFNYGDDWHRNKLISTTIKINYYHPIDFYNLKQSVFKGNRFFWKSADDQTHVVGLGISATLSSSDPTERFAEINEQWIRILDTAEINNPYSIQGTGPLLFGGFSFDPDSMKETEWDSFGNSMFYLPTYMLTIYNKECYLTVNVINQNKSSEDINESVSKIIKELQVSEKVNELEPISIIKQKEIQREQWIQSVDRIVQRLQKKVLQKVVFARKMKLEFAKPASSAYVLQQLLTEQATSFIFGLEAGDSCFLGASPERLIKKTGAKVLSTCLAGSIGRSDDSEEDKLLGKTLLNDPKNLFEHELVVSMIEDALRPYCVEIDIPKEPILMKTPDIQHLYTPVIGTSKSGQSILQMVEELHPTPALGGVPTKAALQIIRENENMDRGFYAGPIGWMDYQGNGEFIVGIRSGLLKGSEAYLYAGCGLVADSISEDELIETRIKFQPMLKAIGGEFR